MSANMLCLYFVSLTYLFIATVRCESDYTFNFEAGGWFKLHTTPQIWEEAFVRCHDEGAVLASPLNKELANALRLQLARNDVNNNFFLGIHDFFSKGDYVSIEGVLLSNLELNFKSSYLCNRTDTGDCLTMSVDGSVSYSSCKDPLPFICYRKLDYQTLNECGTYDNDYHLNQRTGSCYKVHLNLETWFRAYRICASEGGHLVILNNEEEARIVKDMFPVQTGKVDLWEQFHIGLVAWGEDRIWTTIHGQRIEEVFHVWHPGNPDNFMGYQTHGTLIRDGTLDDGDPKTKAKFVCEKSPDFI